MIKITKLNISYKNFLVLKNLNLNINNNNIYLLFGPNGVGKSTFLKTLINLDNIKVSGEIFFNKIKVKNYNTSFLSRIGYYFSHQIPTKFFNIKNIFLLKTCFNIFNNNKKIFFKLIKYYINKISYKKELLFNIINFNFSGGEQKKTEFLFLIINNPIFILLDEIDSGLDQPTCIIIFKYLEKIKKNKYILIISHNKNLNNFLKINYYIFFNNKKIKIFKCI